MNYLDEAIAKINNIQALPDMNKVEALERDIVELKQTMGALIDKLTNTQPVE